MSVPPWSPQPNEPTEGQGWQPTPPGVPEYPAGQGPAGQGPAVQGPWHAPGYAYAYLDPNDPLVTPPDAGINAWYARVIGVLRRSGGALLTIVVVTQALPALVFGFIGLVYSDQMSSSALSQPGAERLPPEQAAAEIERLFGGLAAFLGVLAVAALLLSLLQALGYAAGTWTLVRAAAGEPAGLGAAFRYGARRMVGLWGWTLVVGLITVAGGCLCVLPGVYFAFALSLAGPAYLFERGTFQRGNPIGRSWRLTHANFGAVLGRVALVAAVVIGGQLVLSLIQTVVLEVAGADPGLSPLAIGFTVLGVLVSLPLVVVQVAAMVVTYVEQRAREVPLGTATLVTTLD